MEFFYLLSGYFMAASLSREREEGTLAAFLSRKIAHFWPELLAACLCSAAIELIALQSMGKLVDALPDIPVAIFNDLLLLKMVGITECKSFVGADWYLSSLLIGMVLLYPYLKRRGADIYLFVGCLCLLGIFLHGRAQGLGAPYEWVGFTYWGNIRAFCEMGLGASIWPLAQRLHQWQAPFTGLSARRYFFSRFGVR